MWYTFKMDSIGPSFYINKFDYIIEHTDIPQIRCDGYYNRDNKRIVFFDNQKVNKVYRGIIAVQKLERKKQSFLISDERKREKQMSIIRDWQEEYGQSFLNANNTKRGDVFKITSIDVVKQDEWDKPRVQFTLEPVKVNEELTGDEFLAGMGKRNLDALTEEFGTNEDSKWMGKNIVVAAHMTYTMRGGTTKGIIWAAEDSK